MSTAPEGPGNWVVVASAEHVRIGRRAGFMQACHGKAAPLRRIRAGDRIVCYSPTMTFGGKDPLQAFTAIGVVKDAPPYQVEMGGGFCPFRRDVVWWDCGEAAIKPMLGALAFTAGKANWGHQLRLGLFRIVGPDMVTIARAMGVDRLALIAPDGVNEPRTVA